MIELKDRITAMLKENTGMHFLDSGGAYGRNWERNQKRDFENEPACIFRAEEWNGNPELTILYDLWHYLVNFLDYDEDCEMLNKELIAFSETEKMKEENWFHVRNAWIEENEFNNGTFNFIDIYTQNTYNYDNILSQDIEYTHFVYRDMDFIILMVHGGCDIRGGYTKPVIFKVDEMDYFEMAQRECFLSAHNPPNKNQKLLKGIKPPKEWYAWDSDDSGAHWYGQDGEPKLEDVLVVQDKKAYIKIGDKLLELEASVTESY